MNLATTILDHQATAARSKLIRSWASSGFPYLHVYLELKEMSGCEENRSETFGLMESSVWSYRSAFKSGLVEQIKELNDLMQ